MARHTQHGSYIDLEALELLNDMILNGNQGFAHVMFNGLGSLKNHPSFKAMEMGNAAPGQILPIGLKAYNYLFPELVADAGNRLNSTADVVSALNDLGAAMSEDADALSGDSEIPSGYTYLGQFIDHDITLEAASDQIAHMAFGTPFFDPIAPADLKNILKNTRSGSLDLDIIYENPLLENGKFKIGKVSLPGAGGRLPDKSKANDLPRKSDGSRLFENCDRRNDENTILAQLHVAFLKFHNAVMTKQGTDFAAAKRIVCQHYQWIVLHDYLRKICDPAIVDQILNEGNRIYDPTDQNFFMPVEFSAAAFRFGHSMVREAYSFNRLHPRARLAQLFLFTGSRGNMGGFKTLPVDWIIEWEQFLPFETGSHNRARTIDTRLTNALKRLTGPDATGIFQFLAKLNLLRGYLLSLPTGQALAKRILGEEHVLSSDQILANATEAERAALLSANLHKKTPLWYYILAEAAIQNGGHHLGKLGSTIVAETIIGLIRRSSDSILLEEDWRPLPGDAFNLEDMIWYAGLGPGQVEEI